MGGRTLPKPTDHQEARTAEAPAEWPLWKRLGFRFLASYFLLYTFPFPLDFLPWAGQWISNGVRQLWQGAGLWVGTEVLGIEREIPTGVTGSGDMTINYLQLLATVALAVVATLVWSLLDRRRRSYPQASRILTVAAAFYLGLILLSYGLAKIIPTQFTTPRLTQLLQTYGSSSPMRITWIFMGLSPAYTVFSGLMETIPGLLLFFRRTRLLGAMLAVAVLTNVVMLNYCFDVPVKLFSTHLLLLAVALVLVDFRRVSAFFRNRPVPPADLRPLFASRKLNIAAAVLGLLLVVPFIWTGITGSWERYHQWGAGRPKPEIWGIHDVETFLADGEELPPLTTDPVRWQALVVDDPYSKTTEEWTGPGMIAIQNMDDSLKYHAVVFDEDARTFTLIPRGHQNLESAKEAGLEPDVLTYRRVEEAGLVVTGAYEGREIEVRMRERDLGEMQLISRGFRWVNEYPHNR